MVAFNMAWSILKMKQAHGKMRQVELPEEDEGGDAIKYAHPHRKTKLGQLPVNMAISRALAKLGYPIESEKPYGYRDNVGFTVSQPMFNDPPKGKDFQSDLDELRFALEESPLVSLVQSERQWPPLDSHAGNVGYYGNEMKLFDPMYAPEVFDQMVDDPDDRMYNRALQDAYRYMNQWKPKGTHIVDDGGGRPWKERFRQIREAGDELDDFIQAYKDRTEIRPWLDTQEKVKPEHMEQLMQRFGEANQYGDALAWFHNTINNPEQTRLYDFDQSPMMAGYPDMVRWIQESAQSERGPDDFFPGYP
jgi:hypothetical protein